MLHCHISLPEWNWKSPCALLSTLFETLSHLLKINPFPFIHQISLSALSLSPFFVNVHPQHVLHTFFLQLQIHPNPSKSICCAFIITSHFSFSAPRSGHLQHLHFDHQRLVACFITIGEPHTTTCLQWWKLLPRPEVSSFAFGKSGKWGMQIGDKLG